MLDDVDNIEQILPLLPASGGSAVLVTSRHVLVGLDPDRSVTLDVLREDEATRLAGTILRRAGTRDAGAAAKIALRYRLPLAVRQVSDLKAADPCLDLNDASEINDSRHEAAAFALSLQAMTPPARMILRRLSRYPGALVTAPIAATMADLPVDHARAGLAEIYQRGLLIAEGQRGYRMHDLVRAAALGESSAVDADAEVAAADERLFRYVRATVTSAERRLYPGSNIAGDRGSGIEPHQHASDVAALAWLDEHHADLLAVARRCVAVGATTAWRLAHDLEFYQRIRGFHAEIVELQTGALRLAERAGDRSGEACMHYNLGLLDMLNNDQPVLHELESRGLVNPTSRDQHIVRPEPDRSVARAAREIEAGLDQSPAQPAAAPGRVDEQDP